MNLFSFEKKNSFVFIKNKISSFHFSFETKKPPRKIRRGFSSNFYLFIFFFKEGDKEKKQI